VQLVQLSESSRAKKADDSFREGKIECSCLVGRFLTIEQNAVERKPFGMQLCPLPKERADLGGNRYLNTDHEFNIPPLHEPPSYKATCDSPSPKKTKPTRNLLTHFQHRPES
jgi:hypothetical protein